MTVLRGVTVSFGMSDVCRKNRLSFNLLSFEVNRVNGSTIGSRMDISI